MITFWLFWITTGALALSAVAALLILLANKLDLIKTERTRLSTARVRAEGGI